MKKTILALSFALFTLIGCTDNNVTNDIYLIPKNYEGYVYAFYNVKGAPEVKREGHHEVYTVNDKGYYTTSTFDMDYGTITNQYYYVNKNGKRTKINKECVREIGNGSVEYDRGSSKKIKINYTGIEITKEVCGQEFMQSSDSINHDDLDPLLAEVVQKYYEVNIHKGGLK
ncbi:hypothetical protein MKZ02_12630 [Pseudobacillus sp. FSL P4-0506]|uniref:DUF6843 domain-containing protein n=1 Tax=Pseudobacillus sp. FSL P4-0506 TaxID=2921576 RepID=UPI0030FC6508